MIRSMVKNMMTKNKPMNKEIEESPVSNDNPEFINVQTTCPTITEVRQERCRQEMFKYLALQAIP